MKIGKVMNGLDSDKYSVWYFLWMMLFVIGSGKDVCLFVLVCLCNYNGWISLIIWVYMVFFLMILI